MQKNPLFSRDFILVASGQIVSLFGNQILRFALPLYLLNQTGSSALFGAISASAFLSMILLFPIGGIIADRVNKKNIMVILDFSTAVLIFIFYLLVGSLDIVPLIALMIMLLNGIQGAYQPAVKASIPVLIPPRNLMQANSVVDLISSLSGLLGPVLGGVFYSAFGLTPILYMSIACFFAAAVMEIFIRIPFEKKPAEGNIFAVGYSDMKESFDFIFNKQPVLWKMSLIFACLNLFLTALVLIAVPVIITQRLGFEEDVANRLYGYAQGVIAAGAILGGILAGALAKRLKPTISPFLLGSSALCILLAGAAIQALASPYAIYIILATACGLMLALSTLFSIQMMSFLQILTPKHLIGKVISCVICLCMCTIPLGQLIYGMVFEKSDTLFVPFYGAALVIMAVAVFTSRIFHGIDTLITHETV